MADTVRDRITKFFQKCVGNQVMGRMPFQTLLETTGRNSGEPRQTPLGGRRVGDQFWFVSEFGDKSQYVRNIKADPSVRVRIDGTWHRGTAHLLPDDDAQSSPAHASGIQQHGRAHLRNGPADGARRSGRLTRPSDDH